MSNNKPTKAVALTYDGEKAPFVSASASSELAEEILEIAREHEVPIYENEQLVETLALLEVGDEIPELLYRTIAEIIAFVYILKGKAPGGWAPEDQSQNKTEENNITSIGTTKLSDESAPRLGFDSDENN
ncbi:MAG: EscU/YscU/HrcU family type III secretion system export apparatus switch protein [Pseudomonadales bacterium]|nr:EscU/YscU/HrcU family type III secretion system export apparatus switch protein [Pseudomonadales bacterium]